MQVSFPATGQSFLSGPFNFAKQKTSGIDADLSYSHNFGDTKITEASMAFLKEDFIKEVNVWQTLDHPNITKVRLFHFHSIINKKWKNIYTCMYTLYLIHSCMTYVSYNI